MINILEKLEELIAEAHKFMEFGMSLGKLLAVLLAVMIILQIGTIAYLWAKTRGRNILSLFLPILLFTGATFGIHSPAAAWGAIAEHQLGDADNPSNFLSYREIMNYPTRTAAENAALSACEEDRQSFIGRPFIPFVGDCSIIETYENTCLGVAIGSPSSDYYYDLNDNWNTAKDNARAACLADSSNSDCTVVAGLATETYRIDACDGLPPALSGGTPQEAGTDIADVGVRGLGGIVSLVVHNQSANAVTYNKGDYLEPTDGDFQRMIITERVVVAAGELSNIPVASRQMAKRIPATGATFYSMPSALQSDENSACQARCLDVTDLQNCVWACETNAQADEEFAASSTNTGGSGGGGSSSSTGLIVGGVVVVGGLVWLLSSGGEEGEFNFSPDFGYSATESGYSANIGGRADFRKDNWHLYYSADSGYDGNGMQEFRYQSGGSYTADFWTAEFSESVSGKTADYDLSLSSDFGSGIWKLSPTYRLHSEYADSEFDTQNSLNLESEFRYNNWQIRPTAGFNWREFGEFADSGTFRINAVHHF